MRTECYNEYCAAAKTVREKVFMEEQGFSYDYDEIDEIAVHMVMFDGDTPVAACRIFAGDKPDVYILGRLAVKKAYRSRGIGSALLKEAKAQAKKLGAKKLILHSQMQAQDFYAKNGFAAYGEIEYEEDCPHIWMQTEL
ncbi:MAG: GNAT family N-acetyltransferase [Clostridia bacterium]|nr:GNAT family N-acetyltransferase [Clostridia bacterium]